MNASPTQTDRIFQALSSRSRRMILDLVKSNPGNHDESLLNPDIQSIIKQSMASRIYKHLVSDTQKELLFSLTQDKPWFEYIEEINDADLICRLAGARLPSMEKTTLGAITSKSRQEIAGYNDMFRLISLIQ